MQKSSGRHCAKEETESENEKENPQKHIAKEDAKVTKTGQAACNVVL
jgi:hypothetical protein